MMEDVQMIKRTMSPEVFINFRDLIYDRSGIFFPENKLYLLEGRLFGRLRELSLSGYEEYFSYLESASVQAEELLKIYSLITINETFFFRNPKQLDIFDKSLLPEFVKKRSVASHKNMKVWSTASSSGEELYTLAIMLKEYMGADLDNWEIELQGTDISKQMLERAVSATYSHNSFRGKVPQKIMSKYFIKRNDRYSVIPEIQSMVDFDYLNLKDIDSIKKKRGQDFIFARNVLIYFDKEMKQRVIAAFHDILNPGGYLFLGEAESLHGISAAFTVEHYPGAFVYRKA